MVPALAVADALRADGAEVAFAGGERAEAALVPEAGYTLHPLGALRGLDRRNPLRAARAALRPDVVMGGGGYVAGPVGAAAVLARVPLVLTEADSHLGLTNRALARFARRVCLAFPIDGLHGDRYLVTGRPVPPPVTDRRAARERFGLAEDDTCVLVFGGSLGARSINEAAIDAFSGAAFHVLHACGMRDYASLRDRVPSMNYDLREYITPFGDALAACDLCVARAGGSIFEIAAHGRAAILVPYPFAAADHQTSNADWMRRAGAAVVVPDAELTAERLAREVGELLGDPGRLRAMGNASAALARPDAARVIAGELLAAAGQR